ncbi:hypothetical protein DFH08DRAFT_897219 [Mycena albidolilacea]|uniref:Uncharacterized protein n=1 Tax=Mycena albidolilacea TaxID=1033008 RepID=A0AAD6Z961_9AGAR|nr:hypothetical protein DFH08DRAFT_897219 [Mycena albidolilacea]
MTQWPRIVLPSTGYPNANSASPGPLMAHGMVPDVDDGLAQGPDAGGQWTSFQTPEHDAATFSGPVPGGSGEQELETYDMSVSEGTVTHGIGEFHSPHTQGDVASHSQSVFAIARQSKSIRTLAFGPTPNDMSIFTSPPAPTTQYYYCPSEVYIANMHNLLCQLRSVVTNLQSITNTFVIDTRTGEDGSSISTLLDVVLLTTHQQGIYCSEICGRWDDVFRRQGLIANGGDDPAICDALYAHSRLVPSPHQNNASLRVLRLTTDPTLAIPLLESGNSTFSLPRHQAIEATLDYLQLCNSISPETVTKCVPVLISTMEDLCEEWLIGILAITARLVSLKEQEAYVAIHTHYMTSLAEIEEKAAKQAAHDTCPLTLVSYQEMATAFQIGIHNLSVSISGSIIAEEMTSMRIPSPQETILARYLGRTMAEWQIAYFLMEPGHQDSHQPEVHESGPSSFAQQFLFDEQPFTGAELSL